MSEGTIVQVDPKSLTIALNVRTDVRVDKEFVASVKELGILQPPMVVGNDAGSYDVVLGQRRVLAAVEAGLATIPVYLVAKSEADGVWVSTRLSDGGVSVVDRIFGSEIQSLRAAVRAGGSDSVFVRWGECLADASERAAVKPVAAKAPVKAKRPEAPSV